MGGGQNDLTVEAHFLLNFRQQTAQHGAGGADGLEDVAGQAQFFDEFVVPVPALSVYQRGGGGVGVLVGGHAGEQVVEIVGNHQKGLGGGKLLRVFFLQRRQLVDGVELLELDAGAGVMLRKGNGQRLPDTVGALVPVGHRVPDALTGFVQKHKVHRPGVDAHGDRRKACGAAGGHAVDDLGGEGVHIPAKMPVFAGNPVFKTVHFF